jgi:hypothetical protein
VVTGSVRIPTEWALPRARIVLTGIDEATKGRETTVYVDDLEGGAAREFSVRDVLPGRYAIDVEPTVWRASLTVAGTGARIELDVPRPCVAEIVVHDAATGEEVLKADVDWSAHSSECLRQGTSSHYDATKHAYILRFPPKVAGYVDVEASGFARYDDSASFDLEGTGAEPIRRVIALHRGGKVVVKVRFDGKPFGGAHVALGREMDDVSLDHGSTGTAGEATFSSLSCNTWWVKLDDLPGFVAEEPKKVEVRESQTVEVVFDLRRKR